MNRINHLLYKSLFLVLLFSGCSQDPFKIDVSNISIKMELIRLDEAVFDAEWSNPQATNLELFQKYGDYYKFYAQFILNNQVAIDSPLMGKYMKGFVSDKTMQAFYRADAEIFGNEKFRPYLAGLEDAFKHFKYYFPKEQIPVIFTFQSGFNYKIVPNDTLLGIGIEWYTGSDSPLIKRLSPQVFPVYEKDKMQPDYLLIDAVKGFLKVKFQDKLEMKNLLSVMVFYGKIMYLTAAILPEQSDYIKMNYTQEELSWCFENEKQIWIFLAENNLLFDNEMLEISKWVNDGPFTNGLPNDSPSRVGIWMGWQMVKQFMADHPKTTLKQLMAIEDDGLFLNSYKPGK